MIRQYNEVGWKKENGEYQHVPLFRDLRPVSREYVSRCRQRVMNYINPSGRLFLDVGSGPIPFKEMLAYSDGYQRRVCVDLSITALEEARNRISDHGLFVMADITELPFKSDEFDAVVAMNVLHFLNVDEQKTAIENLYRVLAPHRTAAASFGSRTFGLMKYIKLSWWRKRFIRIARSVMNRNNRSTQNNKIEKTKMAEFTQPDPNLLMNEFRNRYDIKLLVYRSLNTNKMKLFIHEKLGGRVWLQMIFAFEERFPGLITQLGGKALLVIRKPANS